jgi:hypothetical protein
MKNSSIAEICMYKGEECQTLLPSRAISVLSHSQSLIVAAARATASSLSCYNSLIAQQ